MKLSEQWLREWVSPALGTGELVEQLTMAGLEVDSVEAVSGEFSSVVVSEIVEITPHPDADKLRVCKVACGGSELVQVVCGAQNARLGLKVPFARSGAVLPGNIIIKDAKLRGVPSFGMLCGASELGMEDVSDGLMELPASAPIGTDLREYLGLDDNVIEVDLTPNRGDCLSVAGLAREVGVLNKLDVKTVSILPVMPAIKDIIPVTIEAVADCPRYVGRIVKGVDLSRQAPLWMVERLRRGGIRSINPVVDVTNYVMLELGQPMHAFDLTKLEGGRIVVRKAMQDEKLTMLDGQELQLRPDSLVIADGQKPLALAGIMGGAESGVNESTRDILLESAFFNPRKMAGRARAYGLHTDSSHRFERGVDYTLQARAIERATALILDIVGGEAGPVHEVVSGDFDRASQVRLSRSRLDQVLGLTIPGNEITEILERLGMNVLVADDHWQCEVPPYRFDISIENDLVEEVARIYGYNNLPVRSMRVPVEFRPRREALSSINRVRYQLLARGYQEAITYSFIEPKIQAMFSDEAPIEVRNPISADMAVMRTSLLPGLVSAMLYNFNRQQGRIRLFETGLQFHRKGSEIIQEKFVAGVICGSRQHEAWSNDNTLVDFYDIKGDVESLLSTCGKNNVSFVKGSHRALHPGQTAFLESAGQKVGFLGALHPEIRKSLGMTGPTYVFELSLDSIVEGKVPYFKVLSKFPQVRRDIAVVVDQQIESQRIVELVEQNAGDSFRECILFDVYSGNGVEEGKKSLAVGIIFQHWERSLNDKEIQQAVDRIISALTNNAGASLRN